MGGWLQGAQGAVAIVLIIGNRYGRRPFGPSLRNTESMNDNGG